MAIFKIMENIRTAKSLAKYIKKQLRDRGIIDNTLECIKTANDVHIYYALNNNLHKESVSCSVIYVLKYKEVENAIDNIIKCVKNEKIV